MVEVTIDAEPRVLLEVAHAIDNRTTRQNAMSDKELMNELRKVAQTIDDAYIEARRTERED